MPKRQTTRNKIVIAEDMIEACQMETVTIRQK